MSPDRRTRCRRQGLGNLQAVIQQICCKRYKVVGDLQPLRPPRGGVSFSEPQVIFAVSSVAMIVAWVAGDLFLHVRGGDADLPYALLNRAGATAKQGPDTGSTGPPRLMMGRRALRGDSGD